MKHVSLGRVVVAIAKEAQGLLRSFLGRLVFSRKGCAKHVSLGRLVFSRKGTQLPWKACFFKEGLFF